VFAGEILKIIGNHISHVDFSNCAITHKGIAYLSEALIFATGTVSFFRSFIYSPSLSLFWQ
jgi:hypothetical protein